jgi:ribosome-associated toxin RatA of RatAB toxin-antitoxin module
MLARCSDIITLGKQNKPMRRESHGVRYAQTVPFISASRVRQTDKNKFAAQAEVQINRDNDKFLSHKPQNSERNFFETIFFSEF